jgi:hypothetical protein
MSWPNFNYYAGVCKKELGETKENLRVTSLLSFIIGRIRGKANHLTAKFRYLCVVSRASLDMHSYVNPSTISMVFYGQNLHRQKC